MIDNYLNRNFSVNPEYIPIDRQIAYVSNKHIWICTIDLFEDKDTNKRTVSLIRWKARNQGNLKIWKFHRRFNINSVGEYKQLFNGISEIYGNNKINVLQDNYSTASLQKKIDKLESEKETTDIASQLWNKRFSLMKKNIATYKKTMSEFKAIISNPKSSETDIHDFIFKKKIYWIFGLDYIDIKSKIKFPPNKKKIYEFDLMLLRVDRFWDLVELKGPNESLFDKRTKNRSKPNTKLSEALGQAFTYLCACDDKLENVFKPKAIIVIGNKNTDDLKYRKQFGSFITNLEIITYDDLHNRGVSILKHINNIQK